MTFTARVTTGSGRGKVLGTPTMNLALEDVPETMEHGVYACWTTMATGEMAHGKCAAALHYGPRTMFGDTVSCEVHLIDRSIDEPPARVSVTLVERLRDVREFSSAEELKMQIAKDIDLCRKILKHNPEGRAAIGG